MAQLLNGSINSCNSWCTFLSLSNSFMGKYFVTILIMLNVSVGLGQDTINRPQTVFERITGAVKDYKLDTSAAPDDKITRKIIELRSLRGGFNINEVIEFKLEEDKQKNEMPETQLKIVSDFFRTGNGKKWLDNATTWIYRNHFTYKELKQMVKFYKTSAGQKMATDFGIVVLQSLAAAEMIKGTLKL